MRLVTVGTNFVTRRFLTETNGIDGLVLFGIHSRDAEKAQKLATEYGAVKPYSSYDAIAEDGSVDAVYLAVPNSLHASLSTFFLAHGKAVLCEKPAASNARELDAVLSAARANKRLYMEAYMTRFLPAYDRIRTGIGRIGRVTGAELIFEKYSSRYDAFLRGEAVNTFLTEYSNGAAMDLGVYCLHPLIDFFGVPKAVRAEATLASTGVDLHGSAVLSYDGFDATIRYAKDRTDTSLCRIDGTEGTLFFDKVSEPEEVFILRPDGGREDLTVLQGQVMRYEAEHFVRLFETGQTESGVNTFALSRAVMGVLDEIRRQTGVRYPADT